MSMRWFKACTLTAAVAGLFGGSLRAADDKVPPAPAMAAPAPVPGIVTGNCGPTWSAATTAPHYTTVKVTEWVPEYVQVPRTVYKTEQRQETFNTWKTEYVPEQRTRTYTVNHVHKDWVTETVNKQVTRKVTETVMENKTITERIPVTKTVTVNETRWETQQVTEMRSRTVRHVDSVPVCRELGPSLGDRLKGFSDPCYCPCPRSVTTCKKQVHCETVCEPVTVCKKVAVCVPCTKQVCTYDCVTKCVQVPVCRTRCITECVPCQVQVCKTRCVPECKTECYTVNVCKKVCVPCTRTVCVSVPCTEMTTVCKMVARCVDKQVAVDPGCGHHGPACGNGCGANNCLTSSYDPCCHSRTTLRDRLAGFGAKTRSLGCRTKASPCCDMGCGSPVSSCGGCGH